MNSLYPQFPCLTPLTRIASNGAESILSNLANGKWVRIHNRVLACFGALEPSSLLANLLNVASEEDANGLLAILLEYDFVDSGKHESYQDDLVLQLSSAYLNVTNHCNLECKHCYYGSLPGLSHGLPNSELFKIVDSLDAADILYLVISGGEPLTRPGIGNLLRYIRTKNFQEITLLTNGTVHPDDLVLLVAECVTSIHVSLDGPDEESNAILRGKGSFELALTGIRKFKAAGASRIKVITSITSANINRIDEMRRLCSKLGVEFGTTIFAGVGRGAEYPYLRPSTGALTQLFLKEAISLNCDSSATSQSPLDISAGVTCGSGTSMVSIDCLGDVFPCHLFHQPGLCIGNLRLQPNLKKLVEVSPITKQFRARVVENRKCHGCIVEHFCKGGCLAHTVAAHSATRDPWIERDPFCGVHKSVLSAQLWPTES